LDASVAKGFVVLQRIQSGKVMLVRIVAMLTKLLERFDPEQFRVRESPLEPFEHDDEHEDDLVAATPLCASVVNPLFSAPSRLGSFFTSP
jgi:hypothetical protein